MMIAIDDPVPSDDGDLRLWLSRKLHRRIAAIQQGFAGRLPTAAELDQILVLDALSTDVARLSRHVSLLFLQMLSIDVLVQRFERTSPDYFQRLGADLHPADASDMVRMLMRSTLR